MEKEDMLKKRKLDVIIVGGGPGGLTIGSLLAKEGISSAIIEKDPTVGGRYRAINFHGIRSDNGVRMPSVMVRKAEESYMYKFLKYMGMPPQKTREIVWTMGLLNSNAPGKIEFFSMDRRKGVDNFFDFFAFGSGVPMGEETKQALRTAFRIFEDASEEECRKMVSITFEDWIAKNVQDPIASTIFRMTGPLMGANVTDVNVGQFFNVFGTFPRAGALLFWYPIEGHMQDMVIDPLTKYYTEHEGTILTNRRTRSILIEKGKAKGAFVQNNETGLLEEYNAPVVICAIPIFQALAGNVLRREFLTKDWVEAIENCGNLAYEDLSVFYLLRKEIIPAKDNPKISWIHIMDPDYGLPTYVGDWYVASSIFNVKVPPGKQYIYSYIPGGLTDTPFGLPSRPEMVKESIRRWEAAVGKVFPDFAKAIEYKGMSLNLNWGRYAWARVPTEIDLQSPNIRGLYFAGDTIWSVASMASDKIYQMAFPLRDRILKYLRS
jgi:hypothetical protein